MLKSASMIRARRLCKRDGKGKKTVIEDKMVGLSAVSVTKRQWCP